MGSGAVARGGGFEARGAGLEVPVEAVDGRFSRVTGRGSLREQGVGGPRRTAVVDQAAAAVLLQSWWDSQG